MSSNTINLKNPQHPQILIRYYNYMIAISELMCRLPDENGEITFYNFNPGSSKRENMIMHNSSFLCIYKYTF